MCRCCQLCWEDLYWNCFEEKFCYDETIANYDPTEDEYYKKSDMNGFLTSSENETTAENNNHPIVNQPSRYQRNLSVNSAKIHEEDYRREINTCNTNLGPEILAVFASSQIFHDHKPMKSPPSIPGTHSTGSRNKLEQIREEDQDKEQQPPKTPIIVTTPAQVEEHKETEVDGVTLRPKSLHGAVSHEQVGKGEVINKLLLGLQEAPYFSFRPASENDIFTISQGNSDKSAGSGAGKKIMSPSSTSDVRFSMTPEVPSISFAHLPKNYLDTPTIDKYREHTSLHYLKTAEIRKSMADDMSMPRHYTRKSELMLNIEGLGSNTSIASAHSDKTGKSKKILFEKSKRLKALRNNLPPLFIAGREKGEKEK